MAAPAEAAQDAASAASPVAYPDGAVTAGWCVALAATLETASKAPASELPRWLPAKELTKLIVAATKAVAADEALVKVTPPAGARCTVVGDTHGQLHDVLRLFCLAGWPSADSLFVLNGDFVDRRACDRARAGP
jgi:serine/threonine-protein phosphatase 5